MTTTTTTTPDPTFPGRLATFSIVTPDGPASVHVDQTAGGFAVTTTGPIRPVDETFADAAAAMGHALDVAGWAHALT